MISAAAQAQVLEPSDMEEETWMRARGKTVLSSRAGSCIRIVILLLLLLILPCLFSLLIISQPNPNTAAASASAFVWFGGVKGAIQFDLGMFASSIAGSVVFAAVGMYTLLRRTSSANKANSADITTQKAARLISNAGNKY